MENIDFITANPEYCMGCKNCVLACATEQEQKDNGYQTKSNISVVKNSTTKLPSYCRHCAEPFCLEICPVDAIKKEAGVVLLDQKKCTGCGFCAQACPYGAITNSKASSEVKKGQVANKCDLCYQKQTQGDNPACFSACPTKALELKES